MPKPNTVVGRVHVVSPPKNARGARPAAAPPNHVVVTLEDGSTAQIDLAQPKAAVWADIVDDMSRANLPIYMQVDPSARVVTEVLCPLEVTVAALTPQPSGDIEVELVVSHARHYLRKTHPDFQQMQATLREALEDGALVLVTEDVSGDAIIDVRKSSVPKHPVRAARPAPAVSVSRAVPAEIDLARAHQLFDLVNVHSCDPQTVPSPCIPFMYPRDGCWGRAHEMRRLMNAAGTDPDKVWVYGNLAAATSNEPRCVVRWGWHVAPCVDVRFGDHAVTYVIDPSMFDAPVPQEVWVHAQGDPSATVVHSSPAVFYRSKTGAEVVDDDYLQTNQVLSRYRASLARSSQENGPPPYVVCFKPDIFIRDNLHDQGLEPLLEGGFSHSPDINHFRQKLLDPQTTLCGPAARERDDLFEAIESGQTNYIYVRLQNRGQKVGDAGVDLYWTPPSGLSSPASWQRVGTAHASGIAPGAFALAGPLEWRDIPDRGRYCFVAVVETAHDSKPDLNAVHTLSDFRKLIRLNNQITWKYFDVQDRFVDGPSV